VEQTTDRPEGAVAVPVDAGPPARDGFIVDLWIARALGLIAIGLVLLIGIRHAVDQPIYGPIDEAYHLGYVQKVADTGKPPMLGRDQIVLAHHTFTRYQVVLPGPEKGTAPLPYDPTYLTLNQEEAIQPPLYYYVVAPIVWFTRGADKVYAVRIASTILNALGVLLLFVVLRRTLRRQPLAAGIAAVVLATFTGITYLLSEVQNDALLLPVCVLLIWGFLHDLEKRRVSVWHALAAGAAAATQLIAVPLGAATLLIAALYGAHGLPRGRELRRLWLPFVLYVGPLSTWVALNYHRYHSLIPVHPVIPGAPAAGHATTSELYRRTFELLITSPSTILQTSYLPLYPPSSVDFRPAGLLLVAGLVALALVLFRQRADTRAIGLWLALALGAFVLTFFATLTNAGRSGATGDLGSIFVGRYFVGTLAAIAGGVGVTVVTALSGWDVARRSASIALCGGLIYFSLTASSII
jgi:hypothetical protein